MKTDKFYKAIKNKPNNQMFSYHIQPNDQITVLQKTPLVINR